MWPSWFSFDRRKRNHPSDQSHQSDLRRGRRRVRAESRCALCRRRGRAPPGRSRRRPRCAARARRSDRRGPRPRPPRGERGLWSTRAGGGVEKPSLRVRRTEGRPASSSSPFYFPTRFLRVFVSSSSSSTRRRRAGSPFVSLSPRSPRGFEPARVSARSWRGSRSSRADQDPVRARPHKRARRPAARASAPSPF